MGSIRPAVPADLPAITALYSHHVLTGTATFETIPPTGEEMTSRWTAVTGAGLPWLVAASPEGVLLGYAYAGPYRPRPAYRFTVEDSIYLDPAYTGLGLGGLLLTALIEAAAAAGMRQMIAVIGDSANAPSIRLHARFGFTHTGTLHAVGYKFDRWLDTVLMQRPLS